MELTIKINMDNAAFEDNRATETCRILQEQVIEYLEHYAVNDQDLDPWIGYDLRDANGNTTGSVKVKE